MKAMITDIKRFAVHDGDGIRTTVFFKGCPLRCLWCHNPETFSAKKQLGFFEHKCTLCRSCESLCNVHSFKDGKHTVERNSCTFCRKCEDICPADALRIYGREMTVDEIFNILCEDKNFYESSGGGITLSGGKCLLHPEFCAELLKLCKASGIHTAVDTCGHVPKENLDAVIPYADIFLYDIKAIDSDLHRKFTGADNELILSNLKYLDSLGCKSEIRVPVIPEYNECEVEKIQEFVKTLKNVTKIKLLPYHAFGQSKYDALGMTEGLK